MIHVM